MKPIWGDFIMRSDRVTGARRHLWRDCYLAKVVPTSRSRCKDAGRGVLQTEKRWPWCSRYVTREISHRATSARMKQVVNKNELMRLAAGHVALTAISNSQRRMAGDAAERVAAASTLC